MLLQSASLVEIARYEHSQWKCDTSNKPFEWTGRHQLSASQPQAPRLPLKGSVMQMKSQQAQVEASLSAGYNMKEPLGCLLGGIHGEIFKEFAQPSW